MRIAMISTPFISVPPRNYGGTELVIHELVEGLTARGHHVTLFGTGDARTSAELRYLYPQAQWPPGPMTDVNHVSWAMAAIIADGGYDLIHAHSALVLPLARFIPGLPVVYTIHHSKEEELSAHYENFPDTFYVTISENQRRLEIPLPRCEMIYHGLDADRFRWTETPGDHVCFIARFAEIKGPHTAIDVAEIAGVPIKVAGEIHPVDRAFGEREVLPRLKKPHVDFLGCLGPEGKIPLLETSRALLAPIQWEEPFGLFMIEAMLSGSVRELVEPGVTGFIVEAPEEMAALIRPGGVLDNFDRRRCRERAVERFSRDRMVADHETAYRRIMLEFGRKSHVSSNLKAI
jgi:glycosyltransferase involved in cell wall biosynthesis